jgi:metallo-beta-lactamase class B
MMKTRILLIALFCCTTFLSFLTEKKISAQATSVTRLTHDYLTVDEAAASLKLRESAAKLAINLGVSPKLPGSFSPPYRSFKPIKLFDNLYFVGTATVGAFIVDSGDGLVMLDTGIGDEDVAIMVEGMKSLLLDPSRIKLIFISHEHFDHYGGVQYLKKNVCPDAKVAMSLTGWNLLQSVPLEWAYIGTRPQSIDIYLIDGMKIKIGSEIFQIVATPGHSPGCLSFIFPVTDNGEAHVAGIMGGSAVWPTQVEARLYKASIEYFKVFAKAAKCDVGLLFHSQESDFAQLRIRKPGEPNPLVIGQEKFDTVYLKKFRDRYQKMIESGEISPYKPL